MSCAHRRRRAHPRARRAALGAAARPRAAAARRWRVLPAPARALAAARLAAAAALRGQRRRTRTCSRCSNAAMRRSPPAFLRDGGVIARATTPSSTSCAASRRTPTVPARARGARARAHRHRAAEARLQPRAGLLHRDQPRQAERVPGRLPAPPDGEERRALHHARTEGFEDKVLGAREKALAREKRTLRRPARRAVDRCRRCRRRRPRSPSSTCSPTLAERADTLRWVQPELTDEPVLEIAAAGIRWSSASSRRRSCRTTSLARRTRMLVITGPNMGGKSPTCARRR
jgi:DNA mismatch repair protein MutS